MFRSYSLCSWCALTIEFHNNKKHTTCSSLLLQLFVVSLLISKRLCNVCLARIQEENRVGVVRSPPPWAPRRTSTKNSRTKLFRPNHGRPTPHPSCHYGREREEPHVSGVPSRIGSSTSYQVPATSIVYDAGYHSCECYEWYWVSPRFHVLHELS